MGTKKPRICGHCMTARAVRHGTTYRRQIAPGEIISFTTEDALAELARLCRCPDQASTDGATVGRTVVPEIRRDGQRILRPGVNVAVQLKRRPGTKVHKGHVEECYDDGTVKVTLWLTDNYATAPLGECVVVPADEFVRARQGSVTLV